MKVSSSDFYRELRQALAPVMKADGFTTVKGGLLGWERPTRGGHLLVWFECDKWGWNERWGSTFTQGFNTFAEPGLSGKCMRDQRLGYLLEGFEEYDQLRLRNNAVIARLPGTLNQQLVLGKTRDGRNCVIEGHRVRNERLELGEDLCLNYYSLADAQSWASYFRSELPRFIAMYENETRSALGQGRGRFDRAIIEVQSLAADQFERKLAIFEEFVRTETTDYWKSAGAFWIDEIRKKRGNI